MHIEQVFISISTETKEVNHKSINFTVDIRARS